MCRGERAFSAYCTCILNTLQKTNLPYLHLLQVVQEVLQVLADQQVPEYHLCQLDLEVLSLPIVLHHQHTVSHILSVNLNNLYNVMFLPVHLSLQRGLEVLEVQDVQGGR